MTQVLNRVTLERSSFRKGFLKHFRLMGIGLGGFGFNLVFYVCITGGTVWICQAYPDIFPCLWNCPDVFRKRGSDLYRKFFFSEILDKSGGSGGFRSCYGYPVLGGNFLEKIGCSPWRFRRDMAGADRKKSGQFSKEHCFHKILVNPWIRPIPVRTNRPVVDIFQLKLSI